MEQKFGVTHLLAIVLVIVGTVFLIAGPSFSPTRQLTDDAGSAIDIGDQDQEVLLYGAGILAAILVVGAGLGAGFYMITRQVVRAQAVNDEPSNPLDWRTYGHPAGVLLIGGLFAATSLFFIAVDILPVQASEEAKTVDTFFMIEFITIAFIFGLVVGTLIHTLLFYYRREGETGDGTHFHGNIPLELFWTITPLIFVMILGVFAAISLNDITEEKEGEVGVYVEGFQWGWRFYYPTDLFFTEDELRELDPEQLEIIQNTEAGVRERSGLPGYGVSVPELYFLIDQTVRLDMTSTDVLHAFWVPEFRMKRDTVPGVITDLRYTPILEGEYKVRCAELCGTLHWNMLGTINVVTEQGFDTFIEATKLSFGDPIVAGEAIYTANCQACHSLDGADGTGPTWLNRIGTGGEGSNVPYADFEYVLSSVWFPNNYLVPGYDAGIMPQNYQQLLSEPQVGQVFAFMCTYSDVWEEVDDCLEYAVEIEEARAERVLDDGAAGDDMAQNVDGSQQN